MDDMTFTEFQKIFCGASQIILVNAHGGPADDLDKTNPIYVNLPRNSYLIEVGRHTHSTWETAIPYLNQFFDILCGKNITIETAREQFMKIFTVLGEEEYFDVILNSIKVYKGDKNTQIYNMLFSAEEDTTAFIRVYNDGASGFVKDQGKRTGKRGDFCFYLDTNQELPNQKSSYEKIQQGVPLPVHPGGELRGKGIRIDD